MALYRCGSSGGTLSELFPLTITAISNSVDGSSNGIAIAPIFFKGINTINIKVTGDTGSRSACKYYDLDSDYAHGTVFPSTNFNVDVSSIDGLYFQVYNSYTRDSHRTYVTISVIN